MRKRLLALLLCFAIAVSFAVPVTLATELDSDSTETAFSLDGEPPEPDEEAPAEAEPDTAEEDVPSDEENSEQESSDESIEPDADEETATETEPDTAEPEDIPPDGEHPEEEPSDESIEPDADEADTDENERVEDAPPHAEEPSLYERLMAAETGELLEAILAAYSEDELEAYAETLTETQLEALQQHLTDIAPTEGSVPQTVTFTEAAPFLPPVVVKAEPSKKAAARAPQKTPAGDTEGLKADKTVKDNGDGTYTITMEAYTTGTVTHTETTVPVDIVLVLDQSGSMAWDFNGSSTSTNANRRQYAMKQAVNSFIDAVGEKYDSETSDHRISIVTYNSGSATLRGWTNADTAGVTNLKAGINGLPDSPSGATRVDLGMNEAASLMGSGYSYSGSNTTRQKVVIVFTDGVPTTGTDFDTGVANSAINSALSLKNSGTTVYSIGIFSGANVDQLYGATGFDRISNGSVGSNWSNFSFWNIGDVKNYDVPAGNRFLNYLSSNFADANEIGIKAYSSKILGIGYTGWEITHNFTRSASGYYLTASDANSLYNIFTQISENIQTATIDLGTETVVRDIVTPQFTMPKNTSEIKVYTADSTGGENFKTRQPAPGITPVIDGPTVAVTGFDFNENFVSETKKSDGTYGKKLIIEFTVELNPGFLGGSGVKTNGDDSGIYVDGDSKEPLAAFEVPTVDVPLKEIAVNDITANTYLTNSLSLDLPLTGWTTTETSAGDGIKLDVTKDNYGLEPWQTEYVDLTTTFGGGSLNNLTADQSGAHYTVTMKAKGSAAGDTKTATANYTVNVFQPTAAFQDSSINLGATANYADNVPENNVTWQHNGTQSTSVTMIGNVPTLTFTYAPAPAAFTEDTDVDVTAKIGTTDVTSYVTFQNGSDSHAGTENAKEFTVHVVPYLLTIRKEVSGGLADDDDRFIFHITKDGAAFTDVVVPAGESVTMKVPFGTYAVTEDENWSWRYDGNVTDGTVAWTGSETPTDGSAHKAAVTATNRLQKSQWLSGSANAVNKAS